MQPTLALQKVRLFMAADESSLRAFLRGYLRLSLVISLWEHTRVSAVRLRVEMRDHLLSHTPDVGREMIISKM